MKPSEILTQAKALIDEPHKWCKEALRFGNQLCSIGAIEEINGDQIERITPEKAYSYLRKAIGRECISFWNDEPETEHKDVMQAFDKAIELAIADGN